MSTLFLKRHVATDALIVINEGQSGGLISEYF